MRPNRSCCRQPVRWPTTVRADARCSCRRSVRRAKKFVEVVDRVFAQRIQAARHVRARRETALDVLADGEVFELDLVAEGEVRFASRAARLAVVDGVVEVELHAAAIDATRN